MESDHKQTQEYHSFLLLFFSCSYWCFSTDIPSMGEILDRTHCSVDRVRRHGISWYSLFCSWYGGHHTVLAYSRNTRGKVKRKINVCDSVPVIMNARIILMVYRSRIQRWLPRHLWVLKVQWHFVWVSLPLNQQSKNEKIAFLGPRHLTKIWAKKPKATTKVTPRATNDSKWMCFNAVWQTSCIKNLLFRTFQGFSGWSVHGE